jgi:hypothetical protein
MNRRDRRRAEAQQRGHEGRGTMTKRTRVVPEGYVDEAVIEKLQSSFGAVMNECLPTGTEIINAAARILLGVHVDLTNGDPSATTPEIEARLHKFSKQLQDLIKGAPIAPRKDEVMTTGDPDDLADRQAEAQMRILHVLRELNLVDVPSIGPVVAALTASLLLRVPPKDRPQVARELDCHISAFLRATPAGVVPDHDA